MVDYLETDPNPQTMAPMDVNDVIDYLFDFSSILTKMGGDTLLTKSVAAESGLTVVSSSFSNGNTGVVVVLSSGSVDTSYTVTCTVTTQQGRTLERSMIIPVSAL